MTEDHRAYIAEALTAHRTELARFVRVRVAAADVDDLLQTAALRAVERSDTLKDPTRARAWLFAIHRNLITDHLRRRRDTSEPLDGTLADMNTEPDLCDCSVAQVNTLRPSYSAVLHLVDIGNASLGEAAKTLGITVNNATVRLHRARRALRETLREHCGVENARDCHSCRCVTDGCCAA